MRNSQKNIAIDRNEFPERLRRFREERHLSQSDLADRAGITYRTVHDLELGKRGRCQQKTLLMLARAMDLQIDTLLGPAPADANPEATPQRNRRISRLRLGLLAMVMFAVVVSAGTLWHRGRVRAECTLEDGVLTGRHGILGVRLWAWPRKACPASCRESPLDPAHLLVCTTRDAPEGGQLLCVLRSTGKVIWAVGPDIAAMSRAWGEEDVMSAGFSGRMVGAADLGGDGEPELVVVFHHGLYYPSAVCTVGPDGRRQSQYTNCGHLFDLRIDDLDGDGRDEIIAAGTNNAEDHQGATVFILDDRHRSGAAVDSLSRPGCGETDSARVRVVLPRFPEPYMELLPALRLGAFNLQVYRNPELRNMLSVEVGPNDERQRLLVHLDADLHPVGAEPKDSFLEQTISSWPDSLKTDTGPGDPVWLARWLSGYRRFEAGHWPPPRAGGV